MRMLTKWWLPIAAALAIVLVPSAAQAAGGALDPSFGTSGKVVTKFGSSGDGYLWGAALQKDGKIVGAGISNQDFGLARYTVNGKLDPTFGKGGKVQTGFGSGSLDGVLAVALQADGKVVAAGVSNQRFALARYTPRGALDSSFGKAGKVTTRFPGAGEDRANAIAIQPDGKIVAAGTSDINGWDFSLARYTTSGKLDPTFGTGGEARMDLGSSEHAWAVAIQPNGKILIAGTSGAGPGGYDFAVLRYTKTGVLDPTFGTGGKVLTDMGSTSDDEIHAIAIQPDGKIVAAGATVTHGKWDFALARYTTKGRLDTTFGTGGRVVTYLGQASALAVAIQKNGEIVAAGGINPGEYGRHHFAVVRYTKAGKLDSSFGVGGKLLTDFGATADASAVVIQASGKIVAAGVRVAKGHYAFALARYLSH